MVTIHILNANRVSQPKRRFIACFVNGLVQHYVNKSAAGMAAPSTASWCATRRRATGAKDRRQFQARQQRRSDRRRHHQRRIGGAGVRAVRERGASVASIHPAAIEGAPTPPPARLPRASPPQAKPEAKPPRPAGAAPCAKSLRRCCAAGRCARSSATCV